jgi:hypothetical protein
MKVLATAILVVASIASAEVAGATAPRDSTATVTGSVKGKAAVIKIAPPAGTHLNFDGPWKLTVTGQLPLKNESGVYAVDAFDKKSETFTLELKDQPKAQDASEFKLAYFLCSDDNVWCKRIETTGALK